MHHIHHTEGIILGSRNFGESGRYYYIFTRDLGLVTASAQGVRKMSSKLRFVLQDFVYIKVDLVAGRDFWRVTTASKSGLLQEVTKKPETFAVVSNVAQLLRRLLPGTEANETLFTDLVQGLSILERVEKKEDLRNIEAVIVLRMLNNLGYIGESAMLANLIQSPLEENLISEVGKSRAKVLSQINKALRETHL